MVIMFFTVKYLEFCYFLNKSWLFWKKRKMNGKNKNFSTYCIFSGHIKKQLWPGCPSCQTGFLPGSIFMVMLICYWLLPTLETCTRTIRNIHWNIGPEYFKFWGASRNILLRTCAWKLHFNEKKFIKIINFKIYFNISEPSSEKSNI